MNCTGREVPLYVIWTPEGDRDFGLGLRCGPGRNREPGAKG